MILAVDIGTSQCKVVLFDTNGREVAAVTEEYGADSPVPGQCEVDALSWREAVDEGFDRVAADESLSAESLDAVGVTGQRPVVVPLDDERRVVRRPIVAHSDERATVFDVPELDSWGSRRTYATLLWLREHEREAFSEIDSVVDSRDYVGYELTGELGRSGFDQRQRQRERANEAHDLSRDVFPEQSSYETPIGTLRRPYANRLGVDGDIPVVVAPWDGICSAVGCGATTVGTATATLGTKTTVAVCLPADARSVNKPHVVDDASLRLAAAQADAARTWFDTTILAESGQSDPSSEQSRPFDHQTRRVETLAAEADPASGPVVLPFLAGSGTEHDVEWGGCVGLRDSHTRVHVARGVCEAESYYVRSVCESALAGADATLTELRVAGGRAGSDLRNEITANVLGVPVKRLTTDRTTALGTAAIAASAVGVFPNCSTAAAEMVHLGDTYLPDRRVREDHSRRFETFERLCDADASIDPTT